MSEEENIEVEEWYQSDEDTPYMADDMQLLAPRILAGQEDKQHWQAERIYGLGATTAEGAFGKKLRKQALATRTDEERFGDSVTKIARDANLPNAVRDSVLKLIPLIPDVRYKSAAGSLFGYLMLPYIGKSLSAVERRAVDKILEQVRIIKDKNQKISELNCVEYARLFKRILK